MTTGMTTSGAVLALNSADSLTRPLREQGAGHSTWVGTLRWFLASLECRCTLGLMENGRVFVGFWGCHGMGVADKQAVCFTLVQTGIAPISGTFTSHSPVHAHLVLAVGSVCFEGDLWRSPLPEMPAVSAAQGRSVALKTPALPPERRRF